MRKWILLATILTFGISGFSQSDPAAKELMNLLKEKYNEVSSIGAQFSMEIEIPDYETDIKTGYFRQQGNAFMMDSDVQASYSDGTDIWTHLKELKEVQITSVEDGEEDLSSLSPRGVLEKYDSEHYYYAITEKKEGFVHIEFKPLDQEDEVSKIRIVIDEKSRDITSVKIFNIDGSKYSIKISDIVLNKSYDSDVFTFNKSKYPDIYIEDLRID